MPQAGPDRLHRQLRVVPRLEPAGLRSVASVTFGADDRPAGRLAIAETRRGVFGSEDADLLRALADLVELRLGAPAADDERSRRIVEATQDGVWIIDGSGRTSEASPRLGELLDRPSAELVGRPALELVDPDDRPCGEPHKLSRRGFLGASLGVVAFLLFFDGQMSALAAEGVIGAIASAVLLVAALR